MFDAMEAKKRLALVAPAAGTRSVLEALRGVRVRGGVLECQDMEIVARVPVEGFDGVDTLVSVRELRDVFSAARKGSMFTACTVEGEGLRVVLDGVVAVLQPLRVADWPETPAGMGRRDMPGKNVRPQVEAVLPAVSKDETRPVLNGVCWQDGFVHGCDSYRLHRAPSDVLDGVNIPRRAFKVALKAKGALRVGVVDGFATIRAGELEIVARLIDGQLPKCAQLFPDDIQMTVRANGVLVPALKAAAKVGAENVPATLRFAGGNMAVALDVVDGPSFHADVPADMPDCEPFVIGVNPAYARDAAESVVGDCRLDLVDPLRPMVFSGGNIECLVMPVRLNV